MPLAAVLLTAVLTGCGIGTSDPTPVAGPATGIPEPGQTELAARLFFVTAAGDVRAVSRPMRAATGPREAVRLLIEGPNRAERDKGLTSAIPSLDADVVVSTAKGRVDLTLPVDVARIPPAAVSQLACTAAHADVPGGLPPANVDVRFREQGGFFGPLRCDSSGNAVPAPGVSGF